MPPTDALTRALDTPGEPPVRPLPPAVSALLRTLAAPPRLAAHLRLVHDVAHELADGLAVHCPGLRFDREAVLFGAATHDVGKAVHTAELSGPGSAHEPAGRELLLAHGVAEHLARFAATHAAWHRDGVSVEELLVSTADKVWKGKRVPDLEDLLVDRLAAATGAERWAAYLDLDGVLGRIAEGADGRLAFQAAFPVHP
ncbi:MULTISPECIES: HD domain-containing protein [unclassified Streptomyces]|uniref:HD domain-containing protein n=1 Tax=unclassified Streptomyces TaxID=2593676 RepID=UPI0005EC02E8|nr:MULTISPECIES: HD domain-containing protein [unclassified Streptomyces]APU38893.1 phosphohydrolase [Streptomyces sp. TN58]KJK47748.1 phosphohydrolase [Streptomyces sp. NRRL F-4428]